MIPILPIPLTPTLAESALASPQTLAFWLAIGLVVCGVVLLAAVAYTYIRRSRSGTSDEPVESLSTGTIPEAERLLRLMGDAEELAARLTTELDDKSRHLEHLLRQADGRIANLDRRGASPPAPTHAPEPSRVITRPINLATTIHAPSPISSLGGQPSLSAIAHKPAARPELIPAPKPYTPTPPAPEVEGAADLMVAEIHKLSDDGLSPADIAQRLNQHVGKVELILALRQA